MPRNILFLQAELTRPTGEWLAMHQWTASSLKTFPKKAASDPFQIIVYAPKTPQDFAKGSSLRTLYPNAWIAVSLKDAWVATLAKEENPASYFDEILGAPFEDAVVRLSLSHWTRHVESREKVTELETSAESLRLQCEDLERLSGQLVRQVERDVELASRIQRSLHPKLIPTLPGIFLKAKFLPAAGTGGDYYDIFQFGDGRLGILLADSKSHGMAASLLTVLIKIRLEEMKERFFDTHTLVEHINREIQAVHGKEISSVSLLYGILDRKSLTFQYTVAGPLGPLLWRLGEMAPLNTVVNPALGEVSDYSFQESFISLKPADLLVFSTDGLDAPLAAGQTAHSNRIQSLAEILKAATEPGDLLSTQNEILSHVDRHTESSPLPDDITLIQLLIDSQTLYVASESK